jgi:hypothetical protein
MLIFVALLLTAACASGSVAAPPAMAVSDELLGIFADPDAIPETQEPAFVGTVFVPNDAGVAAAPHRTCRSSCL